MYSVVGLFMLTHLIFLSLLRDNIIYMLKKGVTIN